MDLQFSIVLLAIISWIYFLANFILLFFGFDRNLVDLVWLHLKFILYKNFNFSVTPLCVFMSKNTEVFNSFSLEF